MGLCLQLLSMAVTEKSRGNDKGKEIDSAAIIQAAMVKSCQEPEADLQTANEAAGSTLDALGSLRVEPVGGHFSRFFGQSEVRISHQPVPLSVMPSSVW